MICVTRMALKAVRLLLVVSTCIVSQAEEFKSFEDINREYGEGFHTVSEVFSNDAIFALAGNSKVILRRVQGVRQTEEIDPFYGAYIPSTQGVSLLRSVFSRFLSEDDLGGQILGVNEKNALIEIHHGEKRFLVMLTIPEEKGVPGRVVSSWSLSPDLAEALRQAWRSRTK